MHVRLVFRRSRARFLRSGKIFSVEIGLEIIFIAIISPPLIQIGQLSVSGERGCTGQLLRSKSVQGKCGLRLTDCLDITLVVQWDVK